MYVDLSYNSEFTELMIHLKAKYGKKFFELDGIGSQLDLNIFSQKFYLSSKTTMADDSADSNANIDTKDIIAYNVELPKPYFRLNAYFLLWKKLRQLYNQEIANTIIEMQLSGDIYINDFHGVQLPYSYHKKTTIVLKKCGEISVENMESLFNAYSDQIVKYTDREEINLMPYPLYVLDGNNKFTKLNRILRHKTDKELIQLETKDGFTTIVTSDHPVILENGTEKFAGDLVMNDSIMRSDSQIKFPLSYNISKKYAYMVGFLIGDGFLTFGKKRRYRDVDCEYNEDTVENGYINIAQKDCKKTKIYKIMTELFDNVRMVKENKKDKGLRVGSKKEALKLIGVGKYAWNKKIPTEMFALNKQGLISLLCGIIDSDGCVNPLTGVIDIRVTSFTLVQQLAEIIRFLKMDRVRTSIIGKYKSTKKGFKQKHDLYRVSFKCTDRSFIKYSTKIQSNKKLVFKNKQKDGRWETSKLHKIIPISAKDDFVYDITTDSGHFHSNGLIQHNCFNYSTYDIALNGLTMVKKIKSVTPKYLYSFKSQLEQFVVIASNSTLGATGLADLFIVMAKYVDQIFETGHDAGFEFNGYDKIKDVWSDKIYEKNIWRYVRETIVSFIYTINQPMRISQSPFTNVSLFDDTFLESLVGEYKFLDGKIPKIETIKKIQKIFMTVMNDELKRTPVTFPVTTACFNTDENNEIKDEEFLMEVAKQSIEFGFMNFYNGKTSTLSSCCFDGNQKILTKSSNGIELGTFGDLLNKKWDDNRKNFTVYHNGSWCSSKTVKIPVDNKKLYKIVTVNNKELFVTDDHIHLTNNGDKNTINLTTNDYLAFNTRVLDSYPEKCQKLTYEQGYLIGLYLGDGSKYKRKDSESYEITFSLNESNIPDLDIIKKALSDWNIVKELHIHMQNNTMLTKLYSKELFDIINEYVIGNYSYEKELNMDILLQSVNFRKGICYGWYASDGGNSNRIYTTSKNIISQAEVLFNSIGINTIINVNDNTGVDVITIRGVTYNRNYPLYCIRWYDMKNKRSMADVYKVINNTEYFKIKSIEEYDYDDDFVYCFEMKNLNEPYFTLPNGVITHNCRLRSDTDNEYFNSFGAGSSKIGSLGVVTIGLPRLAYKNKEDEELFLENLSEMVRQVARINNAKRNIIKKRIDNGFLPLYSLGLMSLDRQYSTCGLTGINEALEILGYDILKKEGQEFFIKVLDTINSTNDKMQKRYNAPHNCEQVPAENSSIKLAKKDKLMGYDFGVEFYSNQFIPLIINADMLDRIKLQGLFDKHFSGGAILHVNVEEQITDPQKIVDLIKVCAKMGVVYWALNYNLQKCETGHMLVGTKDTCRICGSKITDNFTRVVGFLTNTKNWAIERRNYDYPKRQWYGGADDAYSSNSI